jgi:uncharacterized protein YigA (DUF484 family)
MTSSPARGALPACLDETAVAEFLQGCPDFFERNGALLAKLRLPHVRNEGTTVSLVERQVEVLRERNQALERKLKELVDVARGNDALADRIHRLSQRLIRARDLPQTILAIETSLREDFDAMHAVLVMLTPEAGELAAVSSPFLRASTRDSADMRMFDSLLEAGKPRCGQVRDSQRDFLFGAGTVAIGSVALAPLGPKGSIGMLAIGSSDAERFHPGMSTEFLSRIADLVAFALTR